MSTEKVSVIQEGKTLAIKSLIPDRLLTIREAVALTGLSVGTLYHFVSANRIPHVRISSRCLRFWLSKLMEWFEQMSVPAKKN